MGDRHGGQPAFVERWQAGRSSIIAAATGVVEDRKGGVGFQGAGRIAADQAAMGAGYDKASPVVWRYQGGGINQNNFSREPLGLHDLAGFAMV